MLQIYALLLFFLNTVAKNSIGKVKKAIGPLFKK
jgi:hypothetical protein